MLLSPRTQLLKRRLSELNERYLEEDLRKFRRVRLIHNDSSFHCPFNSCTHKTDLTNDDQYIDVGYKRYHCKVIGCAPMAFSSRACLLRHECKRHGKNALLKPVLCWFKECPRAQLRSGFARKSDMLDHVREMHVNVASWGRESPLIDASISRVHDDIRSNFMSRSFIDTSTPSGCNDYYSSEHLYNATWHCPKIPNGVGTALLDGRFYKSL